MTQQTFRPMSSLSLSEQFERYIEYRQGVAFRLAMIAAEGRGPGDPTFDAELADFRVLDRKIRTFWG